MNSQSFLSKVKDFLINDKKEIPRGFLKNLKNKKFQIIKTHKNNTSLVYMIKEDIFRKFSTNKRGIKKIKDESQGIKWYQKKSRPTFHFLKKTVIKSKYGFIDTKKISGVKKKSWRPLRENYSFLLQAFRHYKKIFKGEKKTKIHGDLTLDNIYFSRKKVVFFDWEFFGSNQKHYGYDLAYLFLSAIILPTLAGKKISKEDEICFIKLWRILITEKISKKIIKDPFSFYITTIKKDKVLNEGYKISKKKFFPFLIQRKIKNEINKLIKSAIC